MKVLATADPLDRLEADALVVLGFEGGALEHVLDGRVQELYASGEFRGKAGESAILHGPGAGSLQAKRLVIAGAGERKKFDSNEMRNVAGAIVRTLKCKGVKRITLALGEFSQDDFASAAVEGAILGQFEPDYYKTDPKKSDQLIESFTIAGGSQAAAALDR